MPKRPDFILELSVRNIEDFSPEAVAKSPRTFRPLDVVNACNNVAVQEPEGLPPLARSLAHYVAFEFFAHSHATGLYNRQIKLWEAIAKIQKIEIHQSTRGIFGNEKLSEFDLVFQDHKKRSIALAHFTKPHQAGEKHDYLKSTREFLKRATEYPGVLGLFACYPTPFPQKVVDFILKETNSSDSTSRFESLMPKLNAHTNLLEMDTATTFNPNNQDILHTVRLIHPDLHKKK